MPTHSLAAYSLRVKRKYQSGFCDLGNFGLLGSVGDLDEVTENLYATVDAFCSMLGRQLAREPLSSRVLSIGQLRRNAGERIIEGVINAGQYGYEAELIDKDTSTVAHHRQVREAEMVPYYFLASMPAGTNFGIALFQRFGNTGTRTTFMNHLDKHFKTAHPRYLLQCLPLVTSEVADALRNGGVIRSIRVVKHSLPQDLSDQLHTPANEVSVEMVLKSDLESVGIFGQLTNALVGHEDFRLAEFEYVLPNSNTIKIEVELDGKTRTVNLEKPKLRVPFDLTDRVDIESTGHPSFDSISREARLILRGLRGQLGH